MSSKVTLSISATWASVAGTFVAILILFIGADQVGNNFDHDRYFTAFFIIPALVVLLAVIVLQKLISFRVLVSAFLVFEIVVLFIYGGTALFFQAWNGDNLIYIAGYMLVFHEYTFGAMLAGILPLLYLLSLQRIREFKACDPGTGVILLAILKDIAWAVGLAICTLLLAARVALGISHLVLGAVWESRQSRTWQERIPAASRGNLGKTRP